MIQPRLKILVIRHGETDWNKKHVFQGQTDTQLNDKGVRQAVAAARCLESVHITAAYSSDLSRAKLTAEIAAEPHALNVETDVRMREFCFGVFEGLSHDQLMESEWAEHFMRYKQDPFRNRPPHGEQPSQVMERVSLFLHDICSKHQPGETVLVAGHGGSCRMLICAALGAAAEVNRHIRLDNCSISELECRDGYIMINKLNDTHHLASSVAAPVI